MKSELWYLLDQVESWTINHTNEPITSAILQMLIEKSMEQNGKEEQEMEDNLDMGH